MIKYVHYFHLPGAEKKGNGSILILFVYFLLCYMLVSLGRFAGQKCSSSLVKLHLLDNTIHALFDSALQFIASY